MTEFRAGSALARLFATCFRQLPQGRLKTRLRRHVYDPVFGNKVFTVSFLTRNGVRLILKMPDYIQTTIFLTGSWEPHVTKLLSEVLRPGDVFIDVGANIGYFSLLASSLVGENGRVYAFEASPQVFDALSVNMRLNHCENLSAKNMAVSSEPGTCQVWAATGGNIGHSTIIQLVAAAENHRREAVVGCDSLVNLVPSSDLFRARFIKIDVEGAERQVLEGLEKVLGNFSVETEWIIELSAAFLPGRGDDVLWIWERFREAGYSGFLIPNGYTDSFLHGSDCDLPLKLIDAPPSGALLDVLFSRTRAKRVT